MKQFDINRFGKLVRWTLANERSYLLKTFLQYYAIFSFMFILWSFIDAARLPKLGAIMLYIGLFVSVCMGGGYMFISMKDKHALQQLLLLPASNIEKFLMRYSFWLILLPLFIVGFILSDFTQYVANILIPGSEAKLLVLTMPSPFSTQVMGEDCLNVIGVVAFIHSFYLLGANALRSHKFAWLAVTLFFIAFIMIAVSLEQSGVLSLHAFGIWHAIFSKSLWGKVMGWAVTVAIIVFNFWLSYRLFCNRELKGKYIVRLINKK